MAEALPLINGFEPSATVGWSDGVPVSAARFCAAAVRLAETLPRRRTVLNLCEDRLNFMLGFAAALIAGQVSLLPHSRAPVVVRELCAAYPDSYCLADGGNLLAGPPAFMVPPWTAFAGTADAPQLSYHLDALIAFTSGSTGRPEAHSKTWGSLVSDARSLCSDFGVDRSKLSSAVGTVPPQHVFGLETTVMMPLQNGVAVHSGLPLLPADIVAALTGMPGERWLITTPLHLRACVTDRAMLPRLAGLVCATMPLSVELAKEAERLWGVPVQEFYGSTETGAVAMRRPTYEEGWHARPGMRFSREGSDTWVEGGHLPQALKLADRIELVSDTEFFLLGRSSDMAKVAGKRVSLEALNRELQRVPGVRDGVFYIPEDCPPGEARLAALVVAPDLEPAAILGALRKRIDPTFLPRPLLIVDALPRTAMGKLPREEMLTLAEAAKSADQRSA